MQRIQSVDPATGKVVGSVAVTPVGSIPGVVAAARQASSAWDDLGIEQRCALLAPVAEELEARAEELGELITREMGKPLPRAIGEVRGCARGLDRDLDEMRAAVAKDVVDDGRTRSEIFYDPLGVCAAITPWNYPMAMPHWMVLPALVMGNTVILKPSEETPLIARAYGDILGRNLPSGVLQIVQGADDQGRALVASDVDLIAFTGSRSVGKSIMAAASEGLKRIVLELGGKDPLVVLEDADLEKAATFAARSSYENSGQMCVSTERIFVPNNVADEFVAALVEATAGMKVGSGFEDDTDIGPMVNRQQRDLVLAHIDDAVRDGARVVAGGTGHSNNSDNFVMPTVLTGVTAEMRIAREETFGPVACVIEVDSDDQAIELANDSPFGLGAVVFGSPARARRVARKLEAGMIGINRGPGGVSGTPWVGARESGFSFHRSKAGHRNFTQLRVVSEPL